MGQTGELPRAPGSHGPSPPPVSARSTIDRLAGHLGAPVLDVPGSGEQEEPVPAGVMSQVLDSGGPRLLCEVVAVAAGEPPKRSGT